MPALPFARTAAKPVPSPHLRDFLTGHSMEVMPRTAAKIADFRAVLPPGTRVYVVHTEGTPFDDMLATVKRLIDEGFPAMPHVPARFVKDRATLNVWLKRYAEEAGADQALTIAGGPKTPYGDFQSSMQLLETGLFDAYGFKRLHVAGHPEGNRDIDPDGSGRLTDAAIRWKQAFSGRTDAEMAIVTQFVFEPEPVLDWARDLQKAGIDLPVHIGVAGPARLQTLIRYAVACGVGPSLSVLKRRALDLTKLALPFEPTDLLNALATAWARGEAGAAAAVHIFPLGGIEPSAAYVRKLLTPDRPKAR